MSEIRVSTVKKDKGVTLCLGAKWREGNKDYYYDSFSLVFSQPPLSFLPFSTLPNKTYDLGATVTSYLGDHVNMGPKLVFWFTGRVGFIIINAWTTRL